MIAKITGHMALVVASGVSIKITILIPAYKQREHFNDAYSVVYSSQGGHMYRQLIAVTMINI